MAKTVDHFIQRNFREAPAVLEPHQSLRGDLGGYDLDTIQLVMDLEDHFQIDITDEEDEHLRTVADVRALVARKLAEKEGEPA